MCKEPSGLLISFGSSLRRIRLARGMTQDALAEAAGLDRTYISGLERGRRNPTLKVIAVIALRLNVSASELLAREKDSNEEDSKGSDQEPPKGL